MIFDFTLSIPSIVTLAVTVLGALGIWFGLRNTVANHTDQIGKQSTALAAAQAASALASPTMSIATSGGCFTSWQRRSSSRPQLPELLGLADPGEKPVRAAQRGAAGGPEAGWGAVPVVQEPIAFVADWHTYATALQMRAPPYLIGGERALKASLQSALSTGDHVHAGKVEELADLLIACYGEQALERARGIEHQSLTPGLAKAVTEMVRTKLPSSSQ